MLLLSPRRWRRIIWLCIGGIAVVLVLLVGGFALLRYQGQRDLAQALAETDRLDPYWRLDYLEAHRRPLPPPGQNGYDHLLATAAIMPAGWPRLTITRAEIDVFDRHLASAALAKSLSVHDRFSPNLLNEDQATALRPEIERAKDCFASARRIVDFPNGRSPPIKPMNVHINSATSLYMGVLDLAKMLVVDGRERIFDGDISGALADVRAMLHMSRVIEGEPDLMTQLMRKVIFNIACDLFERTLAGGVPSESELALVQKEFEQERACDGCLVGILGQRAAVDRLLEAAQNGEVSREDLKSLFFGPSVTGENIFQRLVLTWRMALLSGNLPRQRAVNLRSCNELVRLARLPIRERFAKLHAHIAQEQKHSNPLFGWIDLSGLGASVYGRYLEDELAVDAAGWGAVVGAAAERFRLANQRWPINLEELTPKYLKSIPPDPYTGEPLRMARKGPMIVLYSVGVNLRDDGGTLDPRFGGSRGADVGFILHDPNHRRLPGKPFVFPQKAEKSQESDSRQK